MNSVALIYNFCFLGSPGRTIQIISFKDQPQQVEMIQQVTWAGLAWWPFIALPNRTDTTNNNNKNTTQFNFSPTSGDEIQFTSLVCSPREFWEHLKKFNLLLVISPTTLLAKRRPRGSLKWHECSPGETLEAARRWVWFQNHHLCVQSGCYFWKTFGSRGKEMKWKREEEEEQKIGPKKRKSIRGRRELCAGAKGNRLASIKRNGSTIVATR